MSETLWEVEKENKIWRSVTTLNIEGEVHGGRYWLPLAFLDEMTNSVRKTMHLMYNHGNFGTDCAHVTLE